MKPKLLVIMVCSLLINVGVVAAQDYTYLCSLLGTASDSQCDLKVDVRISIEYPVDLAQTPLIASTIDPFIQTTKNSFLSLLPVDFNSFLVLDMTYEEFHHSNNILSLVFTTYRVDYGIHGTTSFQTYTFDLGGNKLLSLNDLFRPNTEPFPVLAPLVNAKLMEQFWDPGCMASGGANEDADTYRNFALDQDALTFYFGEYDVAPYICGWQSVTIPLSQLSSILAPEFVS